ncbi:MAG TPA: C1 family peptidase [Acidobacteriaceae bacterium]|nr:C1 family peptidase [Acidobacteriaceae bacterium]
MHARTHRVLQLFFVFAIASALLSSAAAQGTTPNIRTLFDFCRAVAPTANAALYEPPDPCLAVVQQNEQLTIQDIVHLLVIADYLIKNPNPQLLKLLLSNPAPSTNVQPVGDGNWRVTVPLTMPPGCLTGAADAANCPPPTRMVETQGISGKISGIYDSVVFAESAGAQLNLYTNAYINALQSCSTPGTRAPSDVSQSCNLGNLPMPSSLTGAPVSSIVAALGSLATNWPVILRNPLPSLYPPSPADCDGEIGGTAQNGNYGDRSGNNNACTPSSTGLYETLPDSNFPLRPYLTCVKDQGSRETCHTFAATSAMELMVSQNHGVKVNLAEEDLMEHYRLTWSPGYMHETGDSFEELSGAINNNYFFPYEKSWDYNPSHSRSFSDAIYHNSCANYPSSEPGCSDSAPQAPGTCVDLDFFGIYIPLCSLHDAGVSGSPYHPTSVTSFWNPGNTELSAEYMILNLAFNQAVVWSFNVSPNFGAGGNTTVNSKGQTVVTTPGYVTYNASDVQAKPLGGHVVQVVGFAANDELPAGIPAAVGPGYFIIKNSWSNCFADAGYIYLDWEYVKATGVQAFALSSIN